MHLTDDWTRWMFLGLGVVVFLALEAVILWPAITRRWAKRHPQPYDWQADGECNNQSYPRPLP